MDLKEKILGEPFYPDECSSAIRCVTKYDALAAMDELSKIVAIAFLDWSTERNVEISLGVFVDNHGTYDSMEDYYELFTQSKEYKELMDQK